VEGRLQELAGGYAQLREDIRDLREHVLHLDQKVDRFREELTGRTDALGATLGGRSDALDQKVDRFREELSGRIESLGARVDALDDRLTRWLRWLVGILVTALLTQIGVLSAALFR
jgi:chromosome segregation ATPase